MKQKSYNTKILLYIFSGLPATGKSELARYLSERFGAVYLRIDSIEQSLKDNGITVAKGEGYEVAYKVASDNLSLGLSVVADSVNPLTITREAWRKVATGAGSRFCEIEIVCSDRSEHRKRVESRTNDIDGLSLPSWQDVLDREYEAWTGDRIVIDTGNKSEKESRKELITALSDISVI